MDGLKSRIENTSCDLDAVGEEVTTLHRDMGLLMILCRNVLKGVNQLSAAGRIAAMQKATEEAHLRRNFGAH